MLQLPSIRLYRLLQWPAQLLTQGVNGLRSPLLGATALVGDGGIVLDLVVRRALGSREDFGGWTKGWEEAEAAGVGLLLLGFRFVVGR